MGRPAPLGLHRTAADGQKKYRTEIVAEDMIMLGGKGNATTHADMGGIQTYDEQPSNDEVKLEDIPF